MVFYLPVTTKMHTHKSTSDEIQNCFLRWKNWLFPLSFPVISVMVNFIYQFDWTIVPR